MADVLHAADAGGGEAGSDIPGQVEQSMIRPRRGAEETAVRAIIGVEAGDEFRPNFVVRLADHWAERDDDSGAVGATPLHCGDGRFEHAGEGTAPTGMGRADDPGGLVRKQDRAAVGSGDANGKPRRPGHDRVGARPLTRRPWLLDRHDVRFAVMTDVLVRMDRRFERVEGMTGLEVVEVNISVDDVWLGDDDEDNRESRVQ